MIKNIDETTQYLLDRISILEDAFVELSSKKKINSDVLDICPGCRVAHNRGLGVSPTHGYQDIIINGEGYKFIGTTIGFSPDGIDLCRGNIPDRKSYGYCNWCLGSFKEDIYMYSKMSDNFYRDGDIFCVRKFKKYFLFERTKHTQIEIKTYDKEY